MAPPPSVDIVVSAENTNYHGWQSMLFHWSYLEHTGVAPIVVVHGDEPDLAPAFALFDARGGRIQRVPNFRHRGPVMYAPRNQMRTPQLVRTNASHIVVCDPDMVFLGDPGFGAVAEEVGDHRVSMDRIHFLKVTNANRPFIAEVCEAGGIDLDQVETVPMNGAPPHVIPVRLRSRLCQQWHVQLERYLEASRRHHGGAHSDAWISSMWGLVLAMHRLGIDAVITDLCVHTLEDPPVDPTATPILHYSYDTDDFDKRAYAADDTWEQVWGATAPAGRASGVICEQLAAAAEYYGLA